MRVFKGKEKKKKKKKEKKSRAAPTTNHRSLPSVNSNFSLKYTKLKGEIKSKKINETPTRCWLLACGRAPAWAEAA